MTIRLNNVFSIVLIVLCVIVAYLSIYVLNKKSLTPLIEEREPPFFSVAAEWTPYPRNVNVSNRYDCDATNLKPCKLSDPTTIFGCKNFTARCHHFAKDTEFLFKGDKIKIPKNDTSDDGYALSLEKATNLCNVNYGNFVLITVSSEENEIKDYALICECKYPGYVGNDNILGPCESVRICGGKVKTLQVPLHQLECECSATEKSIRYEDGVPLCRELTVVQANEKYTNWDHLIEYLDSTLLETKYFNPTVRDNLNVLKLLDPCARSLVDYGVIIPFAYFGEWSRSCVVKDYGILLRIGILNEDNPNKEKYNYLPNDALIHTEKYVSVRFIDYVLNIASKPSVVAVLPSYKEISDPVRVVMVDKILFGIQLHWTPIPYIYAGTCNGRWPSYSCSFREKYAYPREGGALLPPARPCPGSFLWKRDEWITTEKALGSGVSIASRRFLWKTLAPYGSWRYYGMQYCCHASCQSGLVSFVQQDSANKFKLILSDY